MLLIIESESVSINLCSGVAIPDRKRILLVSSDLQARVRIERAADAEGLALGVISPGSGGPVPAADLIVLDLDQIQDLSGWLEARDLEAAKLVGFFSHVQRESGAAAEAAGVEVYPRGRFWREVRQLLSDGG